MKINYITGYAGTGKSHRLIELSHTLNPNDSIILAPTHKALKRLQGLVNQSIGLSTIHALLGWRPGINENAEELGHIDVTIKKEKELESLKTIVIDEAGMMSEDMLFSLVSKLEEAYNYEADDITLYLFLDPYQLPPVKGIQIQVDSNSCENLTTQHRGESPDVVRLFTKFVEYLQWGGSDLTTPESENVTYVKSLEGFKSGDRCLAYTNEAVGRHNLAIATILGINSYLNVEVQIGNLTETYKISEILEPTEDELIKWYENGELLMQDMNINRNYLGQSFYAMLSNDNISFVKVGGYILPVIFGTHKAAIARKKAREKAIENKKHFTEVYALGRAFTCDYTFASTVHKAQGSEFERVWIDKADILKASLNNNFRQYARMMYVAISRAKKRIFILN
jgi:exodeoxyribonuclease-5